MTEEVANTMEISAALMARGVEFTMGMDIARQWATGAQAFIAGDSSIIVFREQNIVIDASGAKEIAIKNVASVVIPTGVLRELHKIIGEQLSAFDNHPG